MPRVKHDPIRNLFSYDPRTNFSTCLCIVETDEADEQGTEEFQDEDVNRSKLCGTKLKVNIHSIKLIVDTNLIA